MGLGHGILPSALAIPRDVDGRVPTRMERRRKSRLRDRRGRENPARTWMELRTVNVELVWTRYERDDAGRGAAAQDAVDPTLSVWMVISWPHHSQVDYAAEFPSSGETLHTLIHLFALMRAKASVVAAKSRIEDGRFVAWLSFPDVVTAGDAFLLLRETLQNRGLHPKLQTREDPARWTMMTCFNSLTVAHAALGFARWPAWPEPRTSSALQSRCLPLATPRGPVAGGGFGVIQLVLASSVAVLLDQVVGSGQLGPVAEEASAVEVDVGEVERHGATVGDLLGLVQGRAGRRIVAADGVIECGGEQGFGQIVSPAGVAEAVDGGGDVRQFEQPTAAAGALESPVPARPGPASGGRGRW